MLRKKENLIEKMGVHIEHKEQIAPVAARIIAALVLLGKRGATFDELITDIGASKSTISTHLTTLQATGRVSYYTKSGDRKKYFILSPNSLIMSISAMIDNWKKERQLHLEIMDYKEEVNASLPEDSNQRFDLEFHSAFIRYLDQAILFMDSLKEKLIKNNSHLN